MYITVRQLANKINSLERFTENDFTIDFIDVYVSNNHRQINYTVRNISGRKEFYNEQTVPHNIIHIINRTRPDITTEDKRHNTLYRYYVK